MGMTKLIMSTSLPDNLDFQASLVEDPAKFVKAASVFGGEAMPAPDANHVGIHLVALGDVEHYGFNRNGDGFPKKACKEYHPTFVKHGHVYRHHKNKDPQKSLGTICKSAYNDPMGRIELFIHAHKEKCAEELEKLAKDKEVSFSMACVLDPDYLVRTIDGYKPISEIVPGDVVHTRAGTWRTVTSLNRRKYTGPVTKIHMNGLPAPVTLTADHLMIAKCFDVKTVGPAATRYFSSAEEFNKDLPDWFHAGHLKVGDRLFYKPMTKVPGVAGVADEGLAKILGYYTAEGSLTYNSDNPAAVEFTCNCDDMAVREIPRIVGEVWPEITVTVMPKENSAAAVSLIVHNHKVAKLVETLCKTGCRGKVVPQEMFNAPENVKLAYAAAWFEGDGWADKKGAHWSSASLPLLLQLRDLLITVGIGSSIYRIDHEKCETSGYAGSGVEYTLNLSPLDAWKLRPWSVKLEKADYDEDAVRTKPTALRPCPNDLYAYRIKEVETWEVAEQETYNFEVAEDEPTYLLAGLISHNCRVQYDRCNACNAMRKNASDPNMCDHIRYELGKTAEDGTFYGTHNDEPKFFDISFVYRPADRIAWSLKTASDGMIDSIKLAEQEGLWLPESVAVDSPNTARKLEILRKLASAESELRRLETSPWREKVASMVWQLSKAAATTLTDEQITDLRRYEVPDTLYMLAKAGIVMDPVSYCKYAMGCDLGTLAPHIEDISKAAADMFSNLHKESRAVDVCSEGRYDVDTSRVDQCPSGLRSVIYAVKPYVSFEEKIANERVVANTIAGCEPVLEKTASRQEGIFNSELVNCVIEKYASYKLSTLSAMQYFYPEDKNMRQIHMAAAQNMIHAPKV